jgi:hypothetical protein
MKKNFIHVICFLSIVTFVSGQTRDEKAAKNFESYYNIIKKSDSSNKNKDSLKDFSDLWIRTGIPEEIKMMIAYDTTKFYKTYTEVIKNSRDTLINILELAFSQNIKDAYAKFKHSVSEGVKSHKFNFFEDQSYSKILLRNVDQTNPPQIGYHQTAIIISRSPKGKVEKNKIIITYTNELEPIDFVILTE